MEGQSPTSCTLKGVQIFSDVTCLELLDSLRKEEETIDVSLGLGAKIDKIQQDVLKHKHILSSVEHIETAAFISADLQRKITALLQFIEESKTNGDEKQKKKRLTKSK